jgi:prepilin-type N-terminal cleavage/methylation domain-containing protein
LRSECNIGNRKDYKGLNLWQNSKISRLTGHHISNSRGFSLIEVCVTVFILGVAIAPMLDAFSPAVTATGSIEETMVFSNQARKTLSRLTALDYEDLYDNLDAPVNLIDLFGSDTEAAKENFTLKGESYTPTVAITDASGGAGGLLKLSVTIHHVMFTTLKAEY